MYLLYIFFINCSSGDEGFVPESKERQVGFSRKRWYDEVKKALVDERGSRCEFCGSSDELRYHYVLPYNEFPDLEFEKRNIMLLCDRCHRVVHRNPFLQADMIKEKASELEIDYRSVYDNLHTEKGFKKAKFLFAKLVLKG